MTGVCCVCGPVNLLWRHNGTGRKVTSCETARKADRKNASQSNRGTHGLTIREARKFREGKVCEICRSPEGLAVDHCHDSGQIRGVLCNRCNGGLGMFRDNPVLLIRAAQYLDPVGEDISGRMLT